MQNRTIQRVLLGVAFTGGAWLALTTLDTAAQAADHHRPAVEQPGGLLDKALPEQASDRAKQVHDRGVPKPKPPECEEPAEQPKPPKAEPKPQPSEEPAEEPADEQGPDKVPPSAVKTPPIVVTLPATDPAPRPDAEDPTSPATTPLPAPPVTVAPPAALPVLIGPVAAPAAVAPVAVDAPTMLGTTAAVTALNVAHCDEQALDAVTIDRVTIHILIANLTEPAASTRAKPAPSCPANPIDHHSDCAGTTATNSGHTNAAPVADLAARATAPALARLTHARPRSTIPAGRHTAIEPGPA